MDWLRVNANFTGCAVDLATWMDLCYRVWQLWRQKINRITRAFMKADLAGKTGEHMAGQVLSRSDRYWQWLYLGCAEIPFHHQQSAPRRAARATAVRCLEAQLVRRWLVYSKASHSWGQDISKETEGLLCLLCSREWRDDQELAWELCQLVRRKFVQVQLIQAWHGLLRKTILGQPEIDLS